MSLALLVASASSVVAEPTTDDDSHKDVVNESIGVLQVATEGVSETAGDKLEQSIEETLADVGFRVVRSHTVREKLVGSDYIIGCTFGPCMAEVRRATGLTQVLVARIQGTGQNYSVVVSLVDTRTGHLQSQVAQNCPVCTVDEAISTAALSVVELITKPNATEVADAQLARDEKHKARGRNPARLRKFAWTALVLGAVAGGAGAYLLTKDEDLAGGALAGGGGGLGLAGLFTIYLTR